MVSCGKKHMLRLTAMGYFWLTYALVLNWSLPFCGFDGNAQFRLDREPRIKFEQARFQFKRHIPLVKKFHVEPIELIPVPWTGHFPTPSIDGSLRPDIKTVFHSIVVTSPRAPPVF